MRNSRARLPRRWRQRPLADAASAALGAHQGSVDEAHLQSYLDEFVFRFNRRRSRSRGMVFYRVLELAVARDPVRYRDLVASPQPKQTPPSRRDDGATRRAWTGHGRLDRGERADLRKSGQMNTPEPLYSLELLPGAFADPPYGFESIHAR